MLAFPTMAERERTILCAEDRKVLLAAFDSPGEPTDALREAMALHRTVLTDGG